MFLDVKPLAVSKKEGKLDIPKLVMLYKWIGVFKE